MKDVMGVINDIEIKQGLEKIVEHRSTAAVPFGGRYRVIDFVLSNMVNSGIKNIGIFTENNSRSLIDHVNAGKEWGLFSRRDGLFILPPKLRYHYGAKKTGDIDCFYSHIDYFKRSRQNYVLLSSSNMLYNINYKKIKDYYEDKKADIVFLHSKDKGKLKSQQNINNSLEMVFMKKSLFLEIIEECILKGYSDFIKEGIIKNVDKYNMYGYRYDGYVANIDCVSSYFSHSMDLLKPEVWRDLFFKEGNINTKINDEAPAKYMKNSEVKNSLVTEGCIIEGKVINSILFRGVKVHKNAVIRNSIIMQKSVVEENAIIENAILDKDVKITAGKVVKGEGDSPIIIGKTQIV
ncbi:MAG: glucose-1-phosphate adenylyltransferase subunit GlgD [Clostridiaceae bacterium]|nr:glucose-1-phosphate adenylyltransferase subunit GlgD [Clostridiaceae bacterium]